MNGKHKVGVFGGTFDPIHIGHLFIARAAMEALALEKVVFIPSGRPPHKPVRSGATDEERIAMLECALQEEPSFDIDLLEIGAKEYTYSYLTMQKLHALHPENEYYFLIGEDSLRDLNTWKNPEELVRYCRIAAAARRGTSDLPIDELIQKQNQELNTDIVYVECPYIDISSSDIRERIKEGRSIRYYTTDAVIDYIDRHHLYRCISYV